MDLQTRRLNFIQEFLLVQNEELIIELEKMLKKRTSYNKDLEPISMEQFNAEIDQSLKDSAEDKVTRISELKMEIEKWN
ncbi:MAG: hypothetical protein ACJAWV_001370 [Flammeovirgaceae bacterium]|jgi:hypothetical protein